MPRINLDYSSCEFLSGEGALDSQVHTVQADRRAGDGEQSCSGACPCTHVWGLPLF